ncbi:MAG: HIT family protein [Candidatus Gracilibacteria bacterium]|nr:HIT family protein [Candidatus Gracilibacteria bacterium]
MNETINKFGYPKTLLKEYKHWVVLLRPKQATLGAMILAHKGNEERLSEVSKEAFIEYGEIIKDIEKILKETFDYDIMNYLMLMMKDKQIHYHVIPRYSKVVDFEGIKCNDEGWPKAPNMKYDLGFSEEQFNKLKNILKNKFQ